MGKGALLEGYRSHFDQMVTYANWEEWNAIKEILVPTLTPEIWEANRENFLERYAEFEVRVSEFKKQQEEEKAEKDRIRAQQEAERRAREFWSDQELDALVKAVCKFPGGTMNRWEKIRDALGTDRDVEEVI